MNRDEIHKKYAVEMAARFVELTQIADIEEMPAVAATLGTVFTNAFSVVIVRKLIDVCDCPDCRDDTIDILDTFFQELKRNTKNSINTNMIHNDYSPLFSDDDPNAALRKELLNG